MDDASEWAPIGPYLTPEATHKLLLRLGMIGIPRHITRCVCDKAHLASLRLGSAPETFVVNTPDETEAINEERRAAFLVAFEASPHGQLWIAKPADGQCAQGIVVFCEQAKARAFATGPLAMQQRLEGRRLATLGGMVIQRYIAAPMLLGGAKFDLRMHAVLLTGGKNGARALLHKHSNYARLAPTQYSTDVADLDSADGLMRHLTNHHADCSWVKRRLPLHELITMLSGIIDAQALWQAARSPVADCLRALKPHADKICDSLLHLFGIDVLLDKDGRGWLLEANAVPQINQVAALHDGDRKLVADLAQLALEEGHDPKLAITECAGGFDFEACTHRAAWEELDFHGSGDNVWSEKA